MTLGLRLSYPALFGDETVFDDLIDVLLLAKITLEIKIPHMLADVWLMYTLWMSMLVARIKEMLMAKLCWV